MQQRRLILVSTILTLVLIPALAWAAPSEFEAARSKGWLMAFLFAFGTGVVTSLTPCVYPMIPIVVGIFGAKEAGSRLRAFGLATMYVLGMGVMFAGLGVIAALTGRAMGSILANPYVVIPMVLLYIALAASMFGAFEMNLPSGLQAKLSTVGGKGAAGAFAMGCVGGLTAAPCTGPFLAGLLAYVTTTRNVPLGGSLLFVYALGIGVLFWVIATFSLSMPKSGRWMEVVKLVGGIGLLVVGFYFLRPIVPSLQRLTSASTAFLAVGIGVMAAGLALLYAHFKTGYGTTSAKLTKVGAIALGFLGACAVVNWSMTPRRPLPWRYDEAVACAEAKATGRNVLVDFGADWCKPCKKIETDIFSDPAVYAHLTEKYIPLKIDVTHDNEVTRAAKQRWEQGDQLPGVILASQECKVLKRFGDIKSPDEFMKGLKAIR